MNKRITTTKKATLRDLPPIAVMAMAMIWMCGAVLQPAPIDSERFQQLQLAAYGILMMFGIIIMGDILTIRDKIRETEDCD